MTSKQTAPRHLKAATRRWFESIVAEWQLEPHHVRLLQLLGETWDRGQQARALIAREGLTVPTRDGGAKLHPAVRVEQASQISFARLLRELDLDIEGPKESARPPMLRSVRGGSSAA